MAEIVHEFRSNKGRPALYPWVEWSDGKSRRIHRGKDFFSSAVSMRTMIHRKAHDMNLRAFVNIENDSTILVRFYDPKE